MTDSIWINNQPAIQIEVMDRGFQYGDGLFETMRVANGKIPLWQQHIMRLNEGCCRLDITHPDADVLYENVQQKIKGQQLGVVKLMVTRGSGGRGYRYDDEMTPNVVMMNLPYPSYPQSCWQQGIEVRLCNTRLANQPLLAGLKHMNRLEQVMARNEWRDNRYQEGLMKDNEDNVVEGTMSNLFIVLDDVVITPSLDNCGVAGVMRQTLLDYMTGQGIEHQVKAVSIQDMENASEVFMTNSVVGVWPVKQFLDIKYEVGDITRRLQKFTDQIFS